MKRIWQYIKAFEFWELSLDKKATALGLLVSIVGVFWVALTLRSSNDTANIDTYLKTYEYTINIDKAMVDSPQLKKYLMFNYSKATQPVDCDTGKAIAFAEWMLDSYDAVLNNNKYFEGDPLTGKQWMKTVANRFHDYPVLREVFKRDADLYGDRLNKVYSEWPCLVNKVPKDIAL